MDRAFVNQKLTSSMAEVHNQNSGHLIGHWFCYAFRSDGNQITDWVPCLLISLNTKP